MLIIEAGHGCNLRAIHDKCPVNVRPKGEKVMTFEQRVGIGIEAYKECNFKGMIAFHYFNEPMLKKEEVFKTIQAIKAEVPEAKFLLWTNGTIIPEDDRMSLFDVVKCTNYFGDGGLEGYYRKYIKDVSVFGCAFDGRLDDWKTNNKSYNPCMRPLIECIFNDFGDCCLCCQDWRNDVKMGNIHTMSLKEILNNRFIVLDRVCRPMTDLSPERCLRCRAKTGHIGFVPEVSALGRAFYP